MAKPPSAPIFTVSSGIPPLNDLHSRPSNNTGPWAKARRRHHGSLGGHSQGVAKESRKRPPTAARTARPSPLDLSNGQEVGAPWFSNGELREAPTLQMTDPPRCLAAAFTQGQRSAEKQLRGLHGPANSLVLLSHFIFVCLLCFCWSKTTN